MNRFLSVLLKKLPGWTGEPIGEEILQAALAVLESNRAGYYTHIQEEWPTEENLRKDITALPPGRSLSDKTFVLLYREGVPAAVVDYIEGYLKPPGMWGCFCWTVACTVRVWGQRCFPLWKPPLWKPGKPGWSWAVMRQTARAFPFGKNRALRSFAASPGLGTTAKPECCWLWERNWL